MKTLINKIKGYVLDKKYERKEAALNARREAMAEMQKYAMPVLTVTAATTIALSGNFSFI